MLQHENIAKKHYYMPLQLIIKNVSAHIVQIEQGVCHFLLPSDYKKGCNIEYFLIQMNLEKYLLNT